MNKVQNFNFLTWKYFTPVVYTTVISDICEVFREADSKYLYSAASEIDEVQQQTFTQINFDSKFTKVKPCYIGISQ